VLEKDTSFSFSVKAGHSCPHTIFTKSINLDYLARLLESCLLRVVELCGGRYLDIVVIVWKILHRAVVTTLKLAGSHSAGDRAKNGLYFYGRRQRM